MPSDSPRHSLTDHWRHRPRAESGHAAGRRISRRRFRPARWSASRILFSDITPCNAHLDRLARKGCEGIRAGGGVPQVFGAPTASDGIMMGHQGMRYSLVSREVIADSHRGRGRRNEP